MSDGTVCGNDITVFMGISEDCMVFLTMRDCDIMTVLFLDREQYVWGNGDACVLLTSRGV